MACKKDLLMKTYAVSWIIQILKSSNEAQRLEQPFLFDYRQTAFLVLPKP